jgi:alpha-D-ribose 1-methylphosphonate 5-triphosphate synthase subunit PhnH
VPGADTPLSCREVFRTAQRATRTSMKALSVPGSGTPLSRREVVRTAQRAAGISMKGASVSTFLHDYLEGLRRA